MKRKDTLIIGFFIAIFGFNTNVFSQFQSSENEFIKEDTMNLAILVLDYETYEFIEGNISYYPLCGTCDYNRLPFDVDFQSPMDEGHIVYNYSYNNDSLFYGTIWWMGQGEIYRPEQFTLADSFETSDSNIPLPENTEYFDYIFIPWEYLTWGEYVQKADSAWLSIDSLQIVNEFSEYTFRVGLYAYTPFVGIFNPEEAYWIVFLYYGNDLTTDVNTNKQNNISIETYPNPSSGLIKLFNYEFYIDSPFEIINSSSQVVLKGNINNELIDLTEQKNGLYFLRILYEGQYVSTKIILQK